MIAVSKIGSDHVGANKNNQDYFFVSNNEKVKIIMDGCGSGDFSEIGPRLFSLTLREKETITPENFEEIVKEFFTKLKEAMKMMYQDITNILYNISTFTILAVFEEEERFTVLTCGDGYIITQDQEGVVLFHETKEVVEEDGEEYPKYFVYNYVDKEKLKLYKEDVTFTTHIYPKQRYVNVGVATDGLRFWKKLKYLDGDKFIQLLKKGKKGLMSRYINKCNEKYIEENGEIKKQDSAFKDDISIVF